MDFIKSMLNIDGAPDQATLAKAFEDGMKLADKLQATCIETALPYMSKGQHIEGALAIMAGLWKTARWMEGGVVNSDNGDPENNPVRKMWELCRDVLMAKSPEEAQAAADALTKRWKQ